MDYNDLMYAFSIVIFLYFRFKLLLISLHTIFIRESILSLYNSAKFLQPKSKSLLPSSNFIYAPFSISCISLIKTCLVTPAYHFLIMYQCSSLHSLPKAILFINFLYSIIFSLVSIKSSTSAPYSGYFFWIS